MHAEGAAGRGRGVVALAVLFGAACLLPLVGLAWPQGEPACRRDGGDCFIPDADQLLSVVYSTLAPCAVGGLLVVALLIRRSVKGTLAALPPRQWKTLAWGSVLLHGGLAGVLVSYALAEELESLVLVPILLLLPLASIVGWWMVAITLGRLLRRRKTAAVPRA